MFRLCLALCALLYSAVAFAATDDFNRADETPLTSPWVRLTGSTGNINLSTNAITASAAGDKFYYYSGAATSAAQYSQFVLNSAPTNNDWGPAVRIGANGFSSYIIDPYTGSNGPVVFKFVAGGFTKIVSITLTMSATDTLRIEANGTSITGKKNGSTITGTPVTDSSLTTAGNGAGIFIYEPGGALDNFDGGDLGGAPAAKHRLMQMRVGK